MKNKQSNYMQIKDKLRSFAEWTKVHHTNDNPAIRQSINDYTDSGCKDYKLTEREQNLLHNYAAKLHQIFHQKN